MSMEITRYHHEQWDGSGYPNGVSGNDIPLSAQIVSLVSQYCATTENRAYRGPYEKEAAITMIQEDAGMKFNPDIVKIYKKIARQLR